MKKHPSTVVWMAFTATLLSFACGKGETVEAVAQDTRTAVSQVLVARPVRTAAVESRDFQPTLAATGTLVPARRALLRALVEGQLDSLPVDIGSRVRKGQLLFEVRTVDYRLALQQAEAGLARAQVQLKDREREKARIEGLAAEGSATQQMRDQAATAHEDAQAGVKLAEASRDMARQALSDCTIGAPYDGAITGRLRERGEYVQKADAVVEIMDLARLDAEVEIPERFAGIIESGLPVELTMRSGADTALGNVVAVNPKVDVANRTFRVKVAVDNKAGRLQAGLFVSASFNLPALTEQLAVPIASLSRDQGRSMVWVVQDGKVETRRVLEGTTTEGWVQVLEGVKAGEYVVTEGAGGLVEGSVVSEFRGQPPK